MKSPHEALKEIFGFESFRPGQIEIINTILAGRDALAVLPTGSGKSLCYQIPAILSEKFSVIISPLIALMKDQVDSINKTKKVAAFINSSIDYKQTENVFREIAQGEIKLLYVSPERLEILNFAERIKNLSPKYLFVDEAHCISEWGHNFRPSYRKIKDFAEFVKVSSIAGFTATAAPEVRDDIILQLKLRNPEIFIRGFGRDNLHLDVIVTPDKKEKTLELIKNFKSPAIIYTSTRKNAEEISLYLNSFGIQSQCYHAGLSNEIRRIVQDDFQNDRLKVICATNAFGMGIDKKDIRLIIHYNMPGSIENYYQEIGRAGRDGESSNTFLLYDNSDRNTQKILIDRSFPDRDQIKFVYNAICDYGKTALNSMPAGDISLDENFSKIVTRHQISKGILSSSINLLEDAGYLKRPSELSKNHFILFLLPSIKLQYYVEKMTSNTNKDLLLVLLRRYGSIMFQQKTAADIDWLAEITASTTEDVIYNLNLLSNAGIIDYDQPSLTSSIRLTVPRVDARYLKINYERNDRLYKHELKKLDRIVVFVFTDSCRFDYILKYFGENLNDYKCGKCDNCLGKKSGRKELLEYIEEIILTLIKQMNTFASRKDILEILIGKTKNPEFMKLANYGIGNLYSTIEIDSAIDTSVAKKYLNEFNTTLSLSEKGNSIVDNILLHANQKEDNHSTDERLELFNRLRQVRKVAADKFSQPANLICPDEILRKIADMQPTKVAEILAMENFTKRMFNKIGQDLLNAVKEHKNKRSSAAKFTNKNLPENISSTLKLIEKGYSLKDISELTKLPESVVSVQIETILGLFPDLSIESLINKDEKELIEQKINEGFLDLKELKQALPPRISYASLRIMLAKRNSI
ncbi:MAG: RecQ family ATP-dependent DNA helicase [bacterium]